MRPLLPPYCYVLFHGDAAARATKAVPRPDYDTLTLAPLLRRLTRYLFDTYFHTSFDAMLMLPFSMLCC